MNLRAREAGERRWRVAIALDLISSSMRKTIILKNLNHEDQNNYLFFFFIRGWRRAFRSKIYGHRAEGTQQQLAERRKRATEDAELIAAL